ncbi:MAG: helix-turn-helix transcriptional regulator [[Eubacterium] siraeum]
MKLRQLRLSKELTVPALSQMSGVPVRTIENIERNGDCQVSTAKKLAEALKVTLDELLHINSIAGLFQSGDNFFLFLF